MPADPVRGGRARRLTKLDRDMIGACGKARRFSTNTCPASRHVEMMAQELMEGRIPVAMREEPDHAAASMLVVVTALYEARTALDTKARRKRDDGL